MSINVGLLGFGKTGSIVASEIVKDLDLNLKWVCRNQIPDNQKFASHSLGDDRCFAEFVSPKQLDHRFLESNSVDLVIDFSTEESSGAYRLFADHGIKIVSAISKYSEQQFKNVISAGKKTAVLASPNITLGINWLLIASKVLKKIVPWADIEIVEEHFRGKPETSGTAIKIAEQLAIDPKNHVNSIRVGGIVGKHEVIFGLPHQTLRLTHESVSRAAFGTGAIFAGKWLMEKDSGLYQMENIIQEKFIQHIADLGIKT